MTLRNGVPRHADRLLDDPPAELFLTSPRHPDTVVRQAAASGPATAGAGTPRERQVVTVLTEALDGDPEARVRRCAATTRPRPLLRRATTRTASGALARHADSADVWPRSTSPEGALLRTGPGAFDRPAAQLERPAVEAVSVAVTGPDPPAGPGSPAGLDQRAGAGPSARRAPSLRAPRGHAPPLLRPRPRP
ncbi:hypothetical protein GCM10019016_098480 [Streptomyces prasinosporus]|uniref:Uncharacterized protein n=1 Tax=Streptomyces prasinosporus TaxID=68256 RepID=A0ABP6U5N2_9ACTN